MKESHGDRLAHAIRWAGYKFTSTVLDDIWPLVLFFTGFATMVTCVTRFTDTNLGTSSTPLTVIGTVVSLVVSFKTNRSFSHWWDGRNIFASLTSNSRQLAMIFWLQVPNVAEGAAAGPSDVTLTAEEKAEAQARLEIQGLIEKKSYVGLILALSVSIKHALRGELGPFYSDLYPLIAFLPKLSQSAHPPLNRDNLQILWHNGLPREKAYKQSDIIAVPLTHPASTDPSRSAAYDNMVEREKGGDLQAVPLSALSDTFKREATDRARGYLGKGPLDEIGFSLGHERKDQNASVSTVELMPPRHPPPTKYYDLFPPLRIVKIVEDWFKRREVLDKLDRAKGGKRRHPPGHNPDKIPLQIMMYLQAYVADLIRRKQLNSSLISPTMTNLQELQKCLTDLDKIATTPLPAAYVIHLRLTVYLYLLAMPFLLVETMGWVTIGAVAIAALIYLGLLELSESIEHPFAYDDSDLDIDQFCLTLQQQLAGLTAFPTSIPTEKIVNSHLNQPFLPTFSMSAEQLLGGPECHGGTTSDNETSSPEMRKRLPRTMTELELALNANWHEIGTEAQLYLDKSKDQLENKTGLEVAVLHL